MVAVVVIVVGVLLSLLLVVHGRGSRQCDEEADDNNICGCQVRVLLLPQQKMRM